MAKTKCHRQIEREERHYVETTVKERIIAGDAHELQFPTDGRMLTIAGPICRPIGAPIDQASFFVVMRTTKGDVILTMNKDQLAVLEQQMSDLMDFVCDEEAQAENGDADAIERMDELENATSPSMATH